MCHTLIIEDEPMVAMLIGEWAEDAGARSLAFADTEAGAVKEALAHPPSFIISDVRLANGTGPRAVEHIMAKLGPIPTMFITGTPDECTPCDHAVAILSKPVQAAEVISLFQRHAPL